MQGKEKDLTRCYACRADMSSQCSQSDAITPCGEHSCQWLCTCARVAARELLTGCLTVRLPAAAAMLLHGVARAAEKLPWQVSPGWQGDQAMRRILLRLLQLLLVSERTHHTHTGLASEA